MLLDALSSLNVSEILRSPLGRALKPILILTISYKALAVLLKLYRDKVLIPRMTVLNDTKLLREWDEEKKVAGRAVIAGGSLAGLFAAAVCAKYFEEVVIMEPDSWTHEHGLDDPGRDLRPVNSDDGGYSAEVNTRARVVQYTAQHAYQPPALIVLRALFSNFDEEAAALGIHPIMADPNYCYSGKMLPAPWTIDPKLSDGEYETFISSRKAFETLLRRLVVKNCRNVSFKKALVTGLDLDKSRNTVRTAKYRDEDGSTQEMEAKMVIDATGVAQAGFKKWLSHLPRELRQEYRVDICYLFTTYKIPEHLHDKVPLPGRKWDVGWLINTIPNQRKEMRGFLIAIQEDNTLICGIGAAQDVKTKHNAKSFKEFVLSHDLDEPWPQWLVDLVDFLEEHEEELAPAWLDYRVTTLGRILYEEAGESLPSNFIAIGDSYMTTNPTYGQGVTKIAYGAACLNRVLLRTTKPDASGKLALSPTLAKDYFKSHIVMIEPMWRNAKYVDYAFAGTTPLKGETLQTGEGVRQFGMHLARVVAYNPDLWPYFLRMRLYTGLAVDVLRPSILWRVLWSYLTY